MIKPTTPLAEDGLGSRTVASLDSIRGYDRPFSRVSWGAIFAGAFFALATQVVLTLLGLSVGLATIHPASGGTPSGAAFGIGAGIWMMISTIASLFAGGYIAGRLGGTFNGWIHGLITWATATILTIMLLTSAVGSLIGTATGLARFAAQTAPQAAQVQLPPQLEQMLNQAQAQAQQSAQQAAPPTQQQVARAADEAAGRTSAGSFWVALTLILGAGAAAFGGKTGRQYPEHGEHEHRAHTETVTAARS